MPLTIELQLSDEDLEKIAAKVATRIRAGKPDAYSIKRVSEMLEVDQSTVRRRVDAGLYPKVPNMSPTKIPAAFIDRLLDPEPSA